VENKPSTQQPFSAPFQVFNDNTAPKKSLFDIYQDENKGQVFTDIAASKNSPFEIYQDENKSLSKPSVPFEIYTDKPVDPQVCKPKLQPSTGMSFKIHCDDMDDGISLKGCGEPMAAPFPIYTDDVKALKDVQPLIENKDHG
jgi:hypothetical protein